ncbi:hypothetical protein MUU74_12260 [Chryseobacterium daecheongense]|uniref:hypothetical protein n=1 Tax=Chryseobacterium daecheongense TaxID=192389 RepID=UPI001FD6EBE0|nr:hypothetical protein [Chryseobacterium daecheongense]UOU97265.1 hypothetical protein MUU74_12260 [Chryseobacterium daecheongense]
MKLENLNSEKFEALTPAKMNKIKGGEIKGTSYGGFISIGEGPAGDPVLRWCDRDREDTILKCTEYLVDGVWY